MSIITRALSLVGLEKRSTIGVNGWPVALSATSVTPTTAQSVSAVYACVQAIALPTASLPHVSLTHLTLSTIYPVFISVLPA